MKLVANEMGFQDDVDACLQHLDSVYDGVVYGNGTETAPQESTSDRTLLLTKRSRGHRRRDMK